MYSLLLLAIINLKLSIHHLRKSDIYLLHKEYYFSCMAESDDDQTPGTPSLPHDYYSMPPHARERRRPDPSY